MNIGFLSLSDADFHVASPQRMPLGGSESAACGLAVALARTGHRVFLLSNTTEPGPHLGVECVRWRREIDLLWQLQLDAAVIIRVTGKGKAIRQILAPQAALIAWCGDDHTQPSVQALKDPEERDAYTGIATVSHWQRENFHQALGVPLEKMAVMRNAISPAFEKLFAASETILGAKERPAVLAYTSTPFRGLDVLLDVFPAVRSAVPGTRLKVFSSMKVYQSGSAYDRERFGDLYARARALEGVEYMGSVPQPELAAALRGTMVLAYPNTFAETSCIAVMEAMAAGCRVVTSNLGALADTTMGFADLVEVDPGFYLYRETYMQTLINVLKQCLADDNGGVEDLLKKQVAFATAGYGWDLRAREWERWLGRLIQQRWVATGP
jgi:glycosyltransferase involved in cell wall biosynthesis